jgi:pimeloyl-[acyl-carrier protein] methyl ester esterase
MMTALKQAVNSQLAYRDEGEGPAMLLVHGWGVSGALFEPQLEALASRYRLIVPDLPGHGASGDFSPHAPFSLLADTLVALIEELGLRRICLVGWSLGAMVAWDLLLRYREAGVAGLVTIDMVPHVLNDEGWPFGLRDGVGTHAFGRDLEAMRADWKGYAALFVPRIFAPGFEGGPEGWVERTLRVAEANDPESLVTIWKRMVEKDFRSALRTIDLPALCACGAQSQLYSVAACQWVARQMPRARLCVFERSGHAPHLEESLRFNQALSEFADSLAEQQQHPVPQPAASGLD